MRADAPGLGAALLRTGQYPNSGHGLRQHTRVDCSPKGYPTVISASLRFASGLPFVEWL
jgi:hypothetical protein